MSARNKEGIQDPPIPIRVLESSPSDPAYPAENVLRGDPLSPGWRSMQSVGFPLFLAVELDGVYDISSVQVVAHESLVPSEVELFTSLTLPATEWVRLGAVKMGTAAQHRARERKTFRFKVRARVIKFVFPDYLPLDKATGQVSITSIIVRGKAFFGQNYAHPPLLQGQQNQQVQQKRAESNPAPSKHLSREMLEKAQQIRAHLDQIAEKKAIITKMIKDAEEKEDYDEAGRCATASAKLSQLATAIEQLQIKKLSALNQQDYKAAGLIKKSQDQIISLISKDIDQIIPVLTGEVKKEKQEQSESKIQDLVVTDEESRQNNVVDNKKEVKFTQDTTEGQSNNKERSRNPSRAPSKAQNNTGRSTAGDDVPVGASKPPLDINDPNFDPSQLRGKDLFKMSDEEERRYNELINNRMRAQQMSDAEQQLEREKTMAQRPAAFKHDLTDQEYANLVIDGSKFPNDPFDYKKYSNILRDGWEKDENTPEELTSAHRTNAEIAKLIELGVEDMIIRLLVHKSLDKVREAVRFFDAALKNDTQRVYEAIYAVRVVAVYQQNQAMLYICQWLILRIYLALLDVYCAGKQKDFFNMRLNFLDVKDQIAKQKDDAVQLARFEIVFQGDENKKDEFQQVEWVEQKLKDLLKDNGKTPVDLYNDVLLLVNPLIQRLNSGLRPARVVALNVLSTLTAFPLFSSKNLYLSLLSWKSINRFTKIQNEKESLEKDQRFQLVVEQRLMSSRALLEKAPFLLTDGSFDVILKLLDTLMPFCNRLETKKAAIYHLQRLYDFDEANGPSKVVKLLNKRISNATLLKQLSQELQQVDVQNEVPAQIKFVQGTKGDKNDPPRIVVVNPAIAAADGREASAPQFGGDFPPGVCQFCCKELTADLEKASEKLWEHIAVDCPCCCVCPACRQIVEVAYASSHLCGQFECGGLKDFQYVIRQCPKCLLGFQDSVFEEHVQGCNATLKGEQMICPLCGDTLDDGESALAHYGDGKCQANPRTAAQFLEIIKNKVADG